jgi:hypothetical protein
MENVRKFYGHLVYFHLLWYYFPLISMLCQEKSGNDDDWSHQVECCHLLPVFDQSQDDLLLVQLQPQNKNFDLKTPKPLKLYICKVKSCPGGVA